jgi:hypothetical protein
MGRGGPGGPGGPGGRGGAGDVPPPGYVCKRCGQGGHWIRSCPTNDDPDFEKNKIRQPVGIPMQRLQPNENGTLLLPDGQAATLTAAEDILDRELGFLRRPAPAAPGQAAPGAAAPAPGAEEMQLAVVPPPLSVSAFTALSLIHISEPTRLM